MLLIISFIQKYLPHLILSAAVLVSGYLVYQKIYSSGYEEAKSLYKSELDLLKRDIEIKKAEVEVLGDVLDAGRASEIKAVQRTLDEYLKELRRLKTPTTVVLPNGKCAPSPEFIEAWNEILRRANATN